MEMKHFELVFLALFLSSGTILVNRFITKVPNWLATVFAVISVSALILYFVLNFRTVKKKTK